jgi:formylglycine-generating enzyme required for sulfatase activity
MLLSRHTHLPPLAVKLSRTLLILSFPGLIAGVWAQSQPGLSLQITGGFPRLTITGDVGLPCSVQYSTNLAGLNNWFTLTNFTLLASPTLVSDLATAPTNFRAYRVAIAVPTNMAWSPPGTSTIGSPVSESQRGPNSETQHGVTLTKGFFMGKFTVTQGGYRSLMNTNPSYFNTNHSFTQDLNRPVEQVSWAEATNYCGLLTAQERAAGRIFTNWTYRLPTEAEWEYACRAGTTTPFYCGNNLTNGMANFDSRYGYYLGNATATNNPAGTLLNRPLAVGGYAPNPWGLYDMAGNIWEWCQDWYGTFSAASVSNPQGPATGSERVFRGGTFNSIGAGCRSANRDKTNPAFGANTIGFRVVLAPP